MSDARSDATPSSVGLDLSRFCQVFFEEAGENLENMDQMLLQIDLSAADDEELNPTFRCPHPVKGGTATFGSSDVAELTHQMETLLDKLRRRELAPHAAIVGRLLQDGDALKAQLARHQGKGGEHVDTSAFLTEIRPLAGGHATSGPAAAPAAVASPPGRPPDSRVQRLLELTIGAVTHGDPFSSVVELFAEIDGLGTIEPLDGRPPHFATPDRSPRRFRWT